MAKDSFEAQLKEMADIANACVDTELAIVGERITEIKQQLIEIAKTGVYHTVIDLSDLSYPVRYTIARWFFKTFDLKCCAHSQYVAISVRWR